MISSDIETNYKNGNKKVKQGTKIGTIKRFGSPDHIHFEIRDSGYDSTIYNAKFGGIKGDVVNPLDYLKNNKNDSNNITGILDGAGSLVSPKESCWGCDKDEARMHPHNGVGSTVVFQWLYDYNTCSQIDIATSKTMDVAIKSKGWSDHLTQKAIKVTLSPYNFVTIKKPTSNSWTTLAITSIEPIDEMTRVFAYCKTPNDSYYQGNRENIETDLVDVTFDYYWTGTASIISQATPRPTNPFGISRDDAVTFNSHNSLTTFQWDTTNCKKLAITNNGTANYTPNVSVKTKGWANAGYDSDGNDLWSEECTHLPCTIEKSVTNYYIIKVKSNPDAIDNGLLRAICVN